MKLYENSKMDYKPLMSSYEAFGLEEMKQTRKISVVSNQLNVNEEKKDSFVLDVESHSSNHHSPSSRIMLQRNFSRKGSQNGGHKKSIASPTTNDKVEDFNTISTASTSSPRASCMPKMSVPVAVGSMGLVANSEVHHQITITASNISTTESKMINNNTSIKRTNSFRKSPSYWAINPRKVLFLFAALSSVGSILLIYLTLSVRKINGNDDALVWQE